MSPPPDKSGTVWFCFADPSGFSGQKAASHLVIHGLETRGWSCRTLRQPVLERENGGPWPVVRYAAGVLSAWTRSLAIAWTRNGRLCLNMGQTRAAFLRDAIPLHLGWIALGRSRVVVSLHGSLFMRWERGSLNSVIFGSLLRRAGRVTVLGQRQKARLVELGIPEGNVVVAVNTCTLAPVSREFLSEKQLSRAGGRPVRLLHLGSLIDTKGFPEYLESLELLSALPGPALEAVLCGPVVPSEFSERFSSLESASAWIEEKLAAINKGPRVRARWIKGASGDEKQSLFRDADIFVMPTRYPVEAQPLVLLEAMASGASIVTTSIGEIPTILDGTCAVIMDRVSGSSLAEALQKLTASEPEMSRLACAALARFTGNYSVDRHIDLWEQMLGTANPGRRSP
jgi:glycosyltransferase involved in cell wall biosynthesis